MRIAKTENWNWFRGIQVSAMRAVAASQSPYRGKIEPDGDYFLRRIFRWYSKTFATPLSDVYELPLEDILMHYWESQYEDMEDEERAAAILRLRESDEDRRLREGKEQEEQDLDAEWQRQVEMEEQERLKNRKEPGPTSTPVRKPKKDDTGLPDYEDKPIEGFKVNFLSDPKEIEDLMKKWDEGGSD